jgi:hypothetical protein
LLAGLVSPASAESPGYGVGSIDKGLLVGAIVGVAAVVGAGIAITYVVLHNREVASGCVAESGGKKTLVREDKKVYSLVAIGPSLPVGERVKLKGHKSGPSSAPAFQVERVLKDYGRCQP